MNLSGVIAQLISLFLMMFVGYIAARAQIITPDFRKKLSTFTLSVAAPGVILSSALQSDMPASGMLSVLLIATLFFFIMIPLAALLSRVLSKNAQEKKLDQLMLVFTNVGFMGIPVAQALYGMNGVAMVSMFILTFNLAFFSYGLMLISGEMTFNLRSLCNPCIFAALGALFFALTGLHLPAPVEDTLASIGSMGGPGAALVMITMVFTQVGIPLEAVALIAGVDRIMDMARTSINVLGDATGALFVTKLEGPDQTEC